MTAPSPTGPLTPPEGRYGPARRPLPKPLLALLLLLAVLAVVPLSVAVHDRLNPPVRADVIGWDIAPNEATVRVQVTKPSGSGARCDLQALDIDGEVVGSRELDVPASDTRTALRVEHTFPTAREAITVEAVRCREVPAG